MTDPVLELRAILGPKGWLSGIDAEPYQRDWLNRYGVAPLGVARPANTAEVAAVVKLCR
ncbi:MAG: FAD-binding oxidoreductase, partial [Mesorhizobium sp.]